MSRHPVPRGSGVLPPSCDIPDNMPSVMVCSLRPGDRAFHFCLIDGMNEFEFVSMTNRKLPSRHNRDGPWPPVSVLLRHRCKRTGKWDKEAKVDNGECRCVTVADLAVYTLRGGDRGYQREGWDDYE